MKQRSLSRKFLITIGVVALVTTALGSVCAFAAFQHELVNRQIAFLDDYVRERSSNIERRFSNLNALQGAAGEELARRMNGLSPAMADALMDRYYPLQADGTRRSRPEAFDSHREPSGELIYGMGALIADAKHLSARDKAAFVAAYELVSNFGQASHNQYDNLYFFTPPKTRLVMFGPDRPDRLMFYRHDAPANLDISHEAMASLTSPAMDPTRATRCTDLQYLIQNKPGERLATACMTPVYVKGQYIGAFGSSIQLSGFFMSAVRNALPGAVSLVTTSKGQLIASPAFLSKGGVPQSEIEAYQRKVGLPELMPLLRKTSGAGVMLSPDGKQIVAYARLNGPNWYFLMLYPRAAVTWSAFWSASWVLGIGLFAAAVQTLLLMLLTRRIVVTPLRRLATAAAAAAADRLDIQEIEGRPDEIGVLARALKTEREKVEQVLASLEQRVKERTAELERANDEKSRFLANMSHELRTPLNGVVAVSQILAARQSAQEDKDLAELIMSSGRLLERVLTDILDFSKIEAGEISLCEEPFDVGEMTGRIAELHRAAAESKGLSFSWRVSDAAKGGYMGDSVRLTQVLSNLLSNAVKFTETGSVELAVDQMDGALAFQVRDTGIGFDDEVKARLFRRFEQADSSIRRRFGGTGLGLAISNALMQQMGGEVSVESVPGVGSVFTASAPLARADVQGVAMEAHDEDDGFSIEGVRVLLAEDHPTNQKVIQLILEPFGVDLQIVENGVLAVERLRENAFDIVLMDMQMPELDGLGAMRALRTLEAETGAARTPVVMLTANAMDEHVRDSLAAGADRHLSKPVSPEALLNTIAELLMAMDHPEEAPALALSA
jgi:signal transduction histidine kinase/CheY-like chemotaxis protein